MKARLLLCVTLGLMRVCVAHGESAEEMAGNCNPYREATVRQDTDGQHQLVFVPAPTMDSEVCWGAFTTFQQLATLAIYPRNDPALAVCLPEKGGPLELIKVFLRYTDDHPERGHEEFGKVLLRAMWKAFPCANSPKIK